MKKLTVFDIYVRLAVVWVVAALLFDITMLIISL